MKKLLMVCCIMLLIAMPCHVFASNVSNGPYNPGSGNALDNMEIKNTMKNTWATVATIVQILAVACVVFAGVRYMLSAADQRADIKQGMIFLAVGATIIFGATSLIRLVASSFNSIVQ